MENQPMTMVLNKPAMKPQVAAPSLSSDIVSHEEPYKTYNVDSIEVQNLFVPPKSLDIPVKVTSFPEFSISNQIDNVILGTESNSSQMEISQPSTHPSQILLLSPQPVLDSSDMDNFPAIIPSILSSSHTLEETPVAQGQNIAQNQKYCGICRICALQTEKFLPLFHGEGITLGLVEKIHQCLPIKVSQTDDLPQQICSDCTSKLNLCHNFINLSIEGSVKLKSVLTSWSKSEIQEEECSVIVEATEENNGDMPNIDVSTPREADTNQHILEPQISTSNEEDHSIVLNFDTGDFVTSRRPALTKDRQWSCDECDFQASRQSALTLHKQNKHKMEQNVSEPVKNIDLSQEEENLLFVCEFCDKKFLSKRKWKKHILCHTKSGPQDREIIQACSVCSETFSNSKNLQEHLKNVHNLDEESKYNCDKCDKSFRLSRSLDIHLATHSNETPYLCDICGKSFKHGSNLSSHKKSHADSKATHRHACDLCPKSFPSKFHLSEHKNVHLNLTPYPCGICGKKFHRRIQLRQHRIIHSQSSYECPQCGVAFNRRGNMTQHMKRHMKELKFTCKVCKESFQTLSEVVQHRRQHTEQELTNFTKEPPGPSGSQPDTKFQCEICNKQLSNRRTLDYHVRSYHTQERPYHCQYCTESFVSREGCLVHERHHTGEKPYSCSECEMRFRCSSNLAQHLKTHRDDRPWACSHCPKSFKRKGILAVHMRTHTGEKPFCCDMCGRRFAQKNDMLKHQQTHTAAKQTFVCGDCSWSFHTRKELNKHRRAHHINSRVESNLNCISVLPSHSQAVLITDDFCHYPVTIVEGSDVIVQQIEDIGEHSQIVEVNPNESNPQIVHFTDDSLLQAVVSESQILTIQAPGQEVLQVEDGSAAKPVISTTMDQTW